MSSTRQWELGLAVFFSFVFVGSVMDDMIPQCDMI